jgi:putative copper export protein
MELHTILRFLHIVSFAAWFGSVLASLFFLKVLEPKLTGTDKTQAEEYASLLRKYIRLETKVADAGVIGVLISGVLLATMYHGWTIWVFVKSGLIIVQIALTLGYIVRAIQPIKYPSTVQEYRRWYRLFCISLSMFTLVLLCSFFLL